MKAEEIFLAALQRPSPTERKAYLETTCGSDAALRDQVEGLLHSHESAGSFLNAPLFESAPTTAPASTAGEQPPAEPAAISLDFLAPPTDPATLGRIDHYEVTETIGRGGMGLVLKARDPKLNRIVAIKVMAPELACNPTAKKRFVREAQAAAAVVHQHIVTIHAVDDEDKLPYLVMEYIDGQSLQGKIDREGHLRLLEILRIGQQVAAGLAAAHAHGLMHRDIKPANILLENGIERVRITDFGLARAVDDVGMTRTGEVAGTPQYMSPEQAQGLPMDARSDLFSFGSVLYAMCTGRPPFRAETAFATARRVCEDAPRDVREVNPEIPEWLAAIIDQLLAKSPTERYQSAAEVADLLGQHLAHLQHPTSAPLPATCRPAQPRLRRQRLPLALAVVALLGLALSLGLSEATGVTHLGATVIRIFTPGGTLVVETNDPGVKVTVEDDGGLTITRSGQELISLSPGNYKIHADKNGQPVPLEREVVSIAQGGHEVVKVKFESMPALRGPRATQAAPPTAVAPFDARAAKGHQEAWAKHLGVPVEFTNAVGMKFRLIPPGEFEMGSTPEVIEAARAADKYSDDQALSDALASEGPLHKVILSQPFYLSVIEVTQQEFETVTGQNPSSFRPGGANADKVKDTETSRLPAQGLSWNDAADFCSRLSVREGLSPNYRPVGTAVAMLPGNGYRLPREAQWEFACRAGTTTRFWFGDAPADHANREWLAANSQGQPHPAGSLAKNPFGLFDMLGNVSEWCQDGWNPESYLLSKGRPAVDPLSKPQGPHQHMVRGGAWTSQPAVRGRSAFRISAVPSQRYESNGFRVVLSVESARLVIDRLAKDAFVVLAGGAERKFDTLGGAVLAASNGDTIEIRGNGPFESEPINVARVALSIRAGEGFRPVVKLKTGAIKVDQPLIASNASLVLEGIELHGIRDQMPAIRVTAPLWATNCRFHSRLKAFTPSATFRNCEFIGAWAGVGGHFHQGTRFRFENCLFATSGAALFFHEDGVGVQQTDIAINHCTFTSGSCVWLALGRGWMPAESSPAPPQPIHLNLSENILDSSQVLAFGKYRDYAGEPAQLDHPAAAALLMRLAEWRGEHNLFSHCNLAVFWEFGVTPPPQVDTLDEWRKKWGTSEFNSQQGRIRFQGGNLIARAENPLDLMTPEDFRLHADSTDHGTGPGGKDLGADVDLVGPGAAYERWKQTPEYEQWLKDSGQLKGIAAAKPEAGAFVLLGGAGVAESKFDTLAEAVQAASDGDTIEIRGNGPFVTRPIVIGQSALTIRAGESFCPVLKADSEEPSEGLLFSQDRLALEGLDLRWVNARPDGPGRYLVVSKGPAARLQAINCRILMNRRGGAHNMGCVGAWDLALCELRNCQLLVAGQGTCYPPFHFRGGPDSSLIVENCLVGQEVLISVNHARPTKAVFDRSTFLGQRFLTFRHYHQVDVTDRQPGSEPFQVVASANVLGGPLMFVQRNEFLSAGSEFGGKEGEQAFKNLVGWKDHQNLYSSSDGSELLKLFLETTPPTRTGLRLTAPLTTLAQWKNFWGIENLDSVRGLAKFRGGDLLTKAKLTPEQLSPNDFRLREDSPGYGAGGKDVGADVNLVGPGEAYKRWKQTPEYREWLKEAGQLNELAQTRPETGAFVLIGGAGVAERKFDTLIEAVQRASAGDTVEIRGNGPFVTSGVTIGQRLVIRAGEGHTPTLTLSRAAAAKNIPLLTTTASLVLEGLELRCMGGAVGKFEGRYPMLVRAWGPGEMSVSNCRFLLNTFSEWSGAIASQSSVCTVRNCQFTGTQPASALSWSCPPGGRIKIENCVSGAGELLSLNLWGADAKDLSIEVRQNTMVGAGLVLGTDQARMPSGERPIRVDFSGNVANCAGTDHRAVLRFDQWHLEPRLAAQGAEEYLRALVALHEQHNIYAAGTRMLHHGQIGKSGFSHFAASQGKDLADWNRFWTQTDTRSTEGVVCFQGGDLYQRTLTTPEQLTPKDFCLREDSAGYRAGKDGKDLGADVNLVGPGAAYERWKQTPEYQEWRTQSGQVVKPE